MKSKLTAVALVIVFIPLFAMAGKASNKQPQYQPEKVYRPCSTFDNPSFFDAVIKHWPKGKEIWSSKKCRIVGQKMGYPFPFYVFTVYGDQQEKLQCRQVPHAGNKPAWQCR